MKKDIGVEYWRRMLEKDDCERGMIEEGYWSRILEKDVGEG